MDQNDKYNSEIFINDFSKINKLLISGVYTKEEYDKRKGEILNSVITRGISQSLEDFLSDILPLKENNLLSAAEINKLKEYLSKGIPANESPKDFGDSNNQNNHINQDKLLPKASPTSVYYCKDCKSEIDVNMDSLKEGVAYCTKCSMIKPIIESLSLNIVDDHSKETYDKSSMRLLLTVLAVMAIIAIGVMFGINYGPKKTIEEKIIERIISNRTNSENTNNTNSSNQIQIKEGPSLSDIEKEATIVVSTIPYKNFQYNTGLFLGRNGVYKNLAVTTVRVNSRKGIKLSDKGIEEEEMNLNISGIADAFSVYGMAQTRYEGRTNFIVDKDFKFIKEGGRWVGYIYDNARNKRNMSRVEKEYMRFRR